MGQMRVYLVELTDFVLLVGGNKGSQKRDIKKAIQILNEVKLGQIKLKDLTKVL